MKIRNGFVSNSSSCSFVIDYNAKVKINDKEYQVYELIDKMFKDSSPYEEFSVDVCESIQKMVDDFWWDQEEAEEMFKGRDKVVYISAQSDLYPAITESLMLFDAEILSSCEG